MKTILNNIIEDLGLNLNLLINNVDKKETKQKITLLKNLKKRLETDKIKDIEDKIPSITSAATPAVFNAVLNKVQSVSELVK